MSLGFLTESALLPSKAKEIRVDSKSLLGLKAVVFQKEQERDERRRRLREEATGDEPRGVSSSKRRKRPDGGDDGGEDALAKSVYARLKAQKRRRGGTDVNRGVDERRRRDDEQRELDVDNSDDDAALQRKSREMLARKAQLYDQMMRGKRDGVPAAAAKECLVDFDGKLRAGELHAVVANGEYDRDRDTVEITDEFGRTRVVEKGSAEHVEYVARDDTKQAPSQQALFFEDKRRDTEARESEAATVHTTGSFVVSQWEKTLKGSEKQYLEQVHAGVELAKQASSALTDKQRRKQLRLEKLKQQQQQSQEPKQTHPPAPTAASDPQQDRQAAVQATAFLNQFESFM